MTHHRFGIWRSPLTKATLFDAARVLRKDDPVGGVLRPARDTLVWILPADEVAVGGWHTEAIKIKN
jgi:hypothetical protein